MRTCQNCYNLFICMQRNKAKYEKYKKYKCVIYVTYRYKWEKLFD